MSSFDGEDLFGSGPHQFEVGGLSLRHVLQESPNSDGVRLSGQGRHGRAIVQTGDLVADDPAGMSALTSAIEAKLDGLVHDLVDDLGRTWPRVVMLSFEPAKIDRVGKRYRTSYRVQYLQTTP